MSTGSPQGDSARIPAGTDYLSPGERNVLELAKREHRDTTAAVKRAATIAHEAVEAGRNTLVEIHRQGEQLDHVERGLTHMEEDVEEASALVKWMRRWICVQLCCCCIVPDPESRAGRKTRQERMRMRRTAAETDRMEVAEKHMAKAAAVDSLIKRHDPAYNGDEDGQRNELFKSAEAIKKERRTTSSGFGVFSGVQGTDREELNSETEKQDEYLDQIGYAVESMKALGQGMADELKAQDKQLDRLPQKTVQVHDNIGNLNRAVRKI